MHSSFVKKLDAFRQTSEDRLRRMQDFTQNPAHERRQTALGLGLLFVLVALWFSPWWLGGRVLAPLDIPGALMQPWAKTSGIPEVRNHFVTDAITQYLPYRLFAEKSYREDGYIGWCVLTFQGFAQDANTMGLFSDWTMQLHRWLPFWTAWHLGLAAQFFIAGSGMLIFLRNRGISAPAAWAGAVAYMGNAQFVIWIYHRWALSAFCWAPWILLAVYRGLASKKITIAPAVFLALAFCGGTLQHAAYTTLAYGLAATGLCLAGEYRADWKKSGLRLVGWFLAGLGLAAFSWVPSLQGYLVNLQLGNLRGALGFSGGWRQPLLNLLAYPAMIFPWIFGRVSSLDLWKILQTNLIDLGWFGFLPTLMAFWALFQKKTPLPARLLMAGGWLIPLTPLVGPFYHRVILVSILGGVWGFCVMLEGNSLGEKFHRRAWKLSCSLIALWLIASAGIWWFQDAIFQKMLPSVLRAAAGSQFGIFVDWTTDRTRRFLLESVIWNRTKIIPLGLALGSLFIARNWSRWNRLRWLLGAIIALETTFFLVDWTTWSAKPDRGILPPSRLVDLLSCEIGPDDLLCQIETGPIYLSGPEIAKLPLPPNTLLQSGIPVLTGYESIMPPRIWQNAGFSTNPQALETLGVTHVLQPDAQLGPTGWKWVTSEEGQSLWENPSSRAHYACQTSLGNAPSGTVALRQRTENHRLFDVPAHTVSVEISENWHAGWKYRLRSGPWQRVESTPVGGQSLAVPDHDTSTLVEMRYFPSWFGWPGLLSLASVLGLAAAAGLTQKRREP